MRNAPLLVLLLSCGPSGPQPVPPPTPIVVDTDKCDDAGTNIAAVCPKLAQTPAGKPFAQFCRDAHEDGIFMNPSCLITAKSCEEANTCIGN